MLFYPLRPAVFPQPALSFRYKPCPALLVFYGLAYRLTPSSCSTDSFRTPSAFPGCPDGLYHTLAFIFDLVSILALLAVIVAAIRRLAFPPSYIEARSRDAFTILGMVAVLMIAFSACTPVR